MLICKNLQEMKLKGIIFTILEYIAGSMGWEMKYQIV